MKQQSDSRCLDLVGADMTYCCIGVHWGNIGVILGLYWDNGK